MNQSPAVEQMLAELIDISRRYGADPAFVLAGGGNTSAKTDDYLWVKASGHALATIGPEGFVQMERQPLEALMQQPVPADALEREEIFKQAVMGARVNPSGGQRPSVECVLHHLLGCRYVVHTHSTVANALTCTRDGEALCQELFGDEVLWLPYVDPGYVLARELQQGLARYREKHPGGCPALVLMGNHGLIVCADTTAEIEQKTKTLVSRIQEQLEKSTRAFDPDAPSHSESDPQKLINTIAPALRGLLAESEQLKVVTFDDSPLVREFVGSTAALEAAAAGPMIPDQIVYCRSFPLVYTPPAEVEQQALVADLRRALDEHVTTYRFLPAVVLVRGFGLFAAADDYAAAETVRLVYRDAIQLMSGAARLNGVKPMDERSYRFIEDWEVEAYRRQVSVQASGRGRAAGKIALVTGAAQGVGLEIARALLQAGAHVALADVNEEGVKKAATSLNNEHKGQRALAVALNVTEEESVAQAIHELVRHWGGCDLFVSNAGVLKAGSVKTQPLADFSFVTAVNYRGYFVGVQNISPVMAVQHLAKPEVWSDIIQINSKSGLEGSNKNGAYAGSKFGGVGLTQSFALELVEDGIKVNSLCPGNFLDSPLWSDPDHGLFVQYLRAGKVPGAQTVADVRRFYEEKVPMRRGCRVSDLMKALFYVMEQEYETGQAIPITGGQIMLH